MTAGGAGADAVRGVFDSAARERRSALVGYLPAGFPSYDGALAALEGFTEGGVDLIEVGLPYSDPVMDGPTIQRAAEQALHAGIRTREVLSTVEAVASRGGVAVVMSYWNPIEAYGVDRFARDLAAAGGAGLITPDLIPEEAQAWIAASDAYGLARIFLVSPSSTPERIAASAAACRGFVYAASVMGVTGTRAQTSRQAPELVRRVRAASRTPVGVGLGVSDGAQAAQVAAYADAVIVGSAFVRKLLEAPTGAEGVTACRDLAADLARGVRGAEELAGDLE